MLFYVSFCDLEDMHYSDHFEAFDKESLVKEFAKKRFVFLPNRDYAINLDHIFRIKIEVAKQK